MDCAATSHCEEIAMHISVSNPSVSNTALEAAPRGMAIRFVAGTGAGRTEGAAFDAALVAAGACEQNLFHLSSVLPPNSGIVCTRHVTPPLERGQRSLVVLAQMRQSQPGRAAHAGIGWMQVGDNGPGLFVELHDEDRDRLESELHATLEAARRRRAAGYGPVHTVIASGRCAAEPVCAVVVGVYAGVHAPAGSNADAADGAARHEAPH
jgi:arginine decarboxylase